MATENPRLIKKYANRKLYDTEERHYVTRDVVLKLVRDGVAVKVIDQVTGTDITHSVLAGGAAAGGPAAGASKARSGDPSLLETVRLSGERLAGVMRMALTLPVDLGQRAAGADPRRSRDVEDLVQMVEDLVSRVEDLEAAVARLSMPAEMGSLRSLERIQLDDIDLTASSRLPQ